MPKIRTLIFHPALAPYRVDLFNELAKYLDLKVIFLRKNLLNQKFDQEYLCGRLKCEYDYLCYGFDIAVRSFRWGVGRKISQFKPDVVVCHEYSPISLLVSARKKLSSKHKFEQVIWTADNIFICEETRFFRRLARKMSLSIADGMIVYTKAVKDWYVQYGVSEKGIGICPNIQKEDSFISALHDALPITKRNIHEYGLIGRRVLLFAGRLVKVKGIDRTLHAFAGVVKSFPDAVMVIVGEGPERGFLETLAASKRIGDSIRFVGRVEGRELLAWYLTGQLFVLASSSEPYGAVVNEALLAGMPVLCSSKAGAVDLIRKGQNGSVFDPYDVSALSEQIKNILATISPLQNEPLPTRKSLMPISFEDAVRGFVAAVEGAV